MPSQTTPPPASAPSASPTPSDHLRTIIGILRPEGLDLARRWIAALMIAPEHEREAIVQAVEQRMIEVYAPPAETPVRRLEIVHPPQERDAHSQQVFVEYAVQRPGSDPKSPPAHAARAKRSAR